MKLKMKVFALSVDSDVGTSVHVFHTKAELEEFLINVMRKEIKDKKGSHYDKMYTILNAADFEFDDAWYYFCDEVQRDITGVWEEYEMEVVCPEVDALICACHAALPLLAGTDDPECDPSTTFADRVDAYKTVRDCIVAAGGEVDPETKFSKCAECSEVYPDVDLDHIEDKTGLAGNPTGQCPSCSALCYETEDRP